MKQQRKKPKIQVSIPVAKLDYQGGPPEIYCPACGRGVCTEAHDGETFCEHVCLIHTDAGGDVLWLKLGLEQKWRDLLTQKAAEDGIELSGGYRVEEVADELEWDELTQTLCDAVESPSAFGLQICTQSGPCSAAVLVVFEFTGEKHECQHCSAKAE